jgi:hypothetical protein
MSWQRFQNDLRKAQHAADKHRSQQIEKPLTQGMNVTLEMLAFKTAVKWDA